MVKQKTREISIKQSKGGFLFGMLSEEVYNFENLSDLRKILSNEKAKILHIVKTQEPQSIYDLAKKLGRGFKSVRDDLKTLEKFGFIEFSKEKTKNRSRYKPVITADIINVSFRI